MTDDGKDYTYVYDVFGRLVKVKARSGGATVAEYGYDGLGQRIWFHADEDADGTVESSNHDPRYNFVYDDRWGIVAVYRVPYSGSDTTPKETYVWHMAGMDGQGGSTYIDSVILRDRDNSNGWTGAPDGTLEERRFYLQNWRADVSAVCNTNGRPLERVKYSAYGVPITLTELDFNLDGNIDPDDPSDFIGAPYDWDLDGDTDASDNSAFASDYGLVSGNAYGRAVLSLAGIRNILGYAGYVGDPFIRGSGSGATEGGQGFKWHVRHRVLDSGLGRWTRRDPLGYVDGVSLYEYVASQPATLIDPDGQAVFCIGAAICCGPVVVSCAALCAGDTWDDPRDTFLDCMGKCIAASWNDIGPGGKIIDACCAAALLGCGIQVVSRVAARVTRLVARNDRIIHSGGPRVPRPLPRRPSPPSPARIADCAMRAAIHEAECQSRRGPLYGVTCYLEALSVFGRCISGR